MVSTALKRTQTSQDIGGRSLVIVPYVVRLWAVPIKRLDGRFLVVFEQRDISMKRDDLGMIDFSKLSRSVRESMIKGFLKEVGLTPPETIGNIDDGIPEVVGLTDVYWNGNFFADIEFQVQWKAGAAPAPFVMRSNKGGAGSVFIPLIDEKVALVKQWRPCLGKHTWEIPRGFAQEWESGPKKLGASAIPKGFATVLAELSEEVGNASDISAHKLGEIAENSGSTTTSPGYWLLTIGQLKLGGSEGFGVKLVNIEDAWMSIGDEILDNHSVVGLTLAMRHLAK